MKLIFGILFLTSTLTVSSQNDDLIKGKWKYEDAYEKEKIDSMGMKMLEMFFGEMTFYFKKEGNKKTWNIHKISENELILIKGNSEEKWVFSNEE